MNRLIGTLPVVALLLVFAPGCGKKKYPASCNKAVDLTAPWTEFGFPTEEGRVCESGGDSAKYMFLDGKADELTKTFEDAVVAKGYAKDKCSSLACQYKNDKEQIAIQPYESTARKMKYVTISLRRSPRLGK